MAIDTDIKRLSVLQIKLPFRLTLPFPSGTVTSPDRYTVAGAYAGTDFNPTPPPTNDRYILGTAMIKFGTTILNQGTAPRLTKGLVRDQLNIIPH